MTGNIPSNLNSSRIPDIDDYRQWMGKNAEDLSDEEVAEIERKIKMFAVAFVEEFVIKESGKGEVDQVGNGN